MLVMNTEEKEVREGVVTYYRDLTTTANYLCRFQKDEAEDLTQQTVTQALETGRCVRRESWIGDKFVVKQIDSDIPAEVVPKMQSLPDSAKKIINKTHREDIHYRNQCLMIVQDTETSVATNYVPDWNDMFAKDWMVL
jgi:hypothetical protein